MVVGWLVATRSHFAHFWGPLKMLVRTWIYWSIQPHCSIYGRNPAPKNLDSKSRTKTPTWLYKQYVVETWGGVPVRITMFIEIEYPNLWELKSVLYKLYNNIYIYVCVCDPCIISTAPQVLVFLLEANPGFSNPN